MIQFVDILIRYFFLFFFVEKRNKKPPQNDIQPVLGNSFIGHWYFGSIGPDFDRESLLLNSWQHKKQIDFLDCYYPKIPFLGTRRVIEQALFPFQLQCFVLVIKPGQAMV